MTLPGLDANNRARTDAELVEYVEEPIESQLLIGSVTTYDFWYKILSPESK